MGWWSGVLLVRPGPDRHAGQHRDDDSEDSEPNGGLASAEASGSKLQSIKGGRLGDRSLDEFVDEVTNCHVASSS
jgi:hypothetical protein